MRAPADQTICGDGDLAVDARLTEREDRPSWTELRLFGAGRDLGLFRAGAESQSRY